MTDPYLHNREFYGSVSGNYRALATDTGLIVLVPAIPAHTLFIQKIHVEVTTPTGAELLTFQDGAGIPIVPGISAAAVTHVDFDFGPDGVPCTEATAFVLNITGAVGAISWATWEGFKKLTLGTAPTVGVGAVPAAFASVAVAPFSVVGPTGTVFSVSPAGNVAVAGNVLAAGSIISPDLQATSGGRLSFTAAPGGSFLGAMTPVGNGKFQFTDGSGAVGIGWDLLTDGTFKIRNRAHTADGQLSAASVRGNAVTFANLPAAPVEGMLAAVTDSTVNTWGTVIAGGGANHVLAYYNGTNWIVK